MYDISTSDSFESTTESKELGLLGAMFDGIITEFEFRHLRVRRTGDSIEVTNQDEMPLGGYLLIESATVASAHEWIEAKADYYGVKA